MAVRPLVVLFLVVAAAARADVAISFEAYQQQRSPQTILRETPFRDIKARPSAYRGQVIEYLLAINGRIEAGGEVKLVVANRRNETISLICPTGASQGRPPQWIAALCRVPDDDPVDGLIALALTQIQPPDQPAQAVAAGADAAGQTVRREAAPTTAKLVSGDGSVDAEVEQAIGVAVLGATQEVAQRLATTAAEGQTQEQSGVPVGPLPADSLPQRQTQPQALPGGLDTGALGRLEAFIARRNGSIGAAERRFIAAEIIRISAVYRMRWEFFASLISAESAFNRRAVSSAGAMGLGQLMPFNVRKYGLTDPFNVTQNLTASAYHIWRHLEEYSRRPPSQQFALALACYNAGPGAVQRHGGVPPYRETINYIQRISSTYVMLCQQTAAATAAAR